MEDKTNVFEIDVPASGIEYQELIYKQLLTDLSNTADVGRLKSHWQDHCWKLWNKIEGLDGWWQPQFDWIWKHIYKVIPQTDQPNFDDFIYELAEIRNQYFTIIADYTTVEDINLNVDLFYQLLSRINQHKGYCREEVFQNKSPNGTTYDEYKILNGFEWEKSISVLKELFQISVKAYKERIIYEAHGRALYEGGVTNTGGDKRRRDQLKDDSRGNPRWKDQAEDLNFWMGVAHEANQLLKNDPETYEPRSDATFLSTNLQRELSFKFDKAESTIRDNLKKYFEKNNRLFTSKNGY
jgi:hypothetical protein